LKWIVIGLGVLLVAGFAVVIATIVMRASTVRGADSPAAPAEGVPLPLAYELPEEARIARYETSRGYLILELAFVDQPRRTEILVFELATGRQVGRIATPDS